MNGIHDLGGMHGFGRVPVEASEPYHAAWELRTAAIMLGLLRRGLYNLDAFRHGIETMAPAHYLRSSYFERWRTSVEQNLIRGGTLSSAELDERRRALEQGTVPPAPKPGRRDAETRVLSASSRVPSASSRVPSASSRVLSASDPASSGRSKPRLAFAAETGSERAT